MPRTPPIIALNRDHGTDTAGSALKLRCDAHNLDNSGVLQWMDLRSADSDGIIAVCEIPTAHAAFLSQAAGTNDPDVAAFSSGLHVTTVVAGYSASFFLSSPLTCGASGLSGLATVTHPQRLNR
jgi:hypothetical protein